VSERLIDPELLARGLAGFSIHHPSIAENLTLPAFMPGEPDAWPPRPVIDPALFAPAQPYDPRFSANWGLHHEQEAAAKREQQNAKLSGEKPRPSRRSAEAVAESGG
jgi:hypothetical protein